MNNLSHDISIFFFRITVSSFMLFGHGLGKLERLLSGSEIKFLDPFGLGSTVSFYLATFAEVISSLLIIAGLFTRINSVLLIITMGVAAFIAHADDPFSGKEKALLFLVSYILIFLLGPGKIAVQRLLKQKKSNISNLSDFILN